jgi:hypothetical protein
MLRWKPASLTDNDLLHAITRIRAQDDAFCASLCAAIEAGREFCPIGVITTPGTKRPISNYHRPA